LSKTSAPAKTLWKQMRTTTTILGDEGGAIKPP